ncbi:NAD(P)H-binding protein [Paraflavisolibacter sp. H34]|uniref:NAD(P)H-binding protein n=1 Tax=Huijunlia imazamoxiresistens TaxID=3127457 RepID=UPI00301AD596
MIPEQLQTAIVIGATGLVGSQVVTALLGDERIERVKIFVRRPSGRRHAKLEEFIIDFDAPRNWEHLVTGSVLFSALGTTLRKAGSKGAQFRIDYTYQYLFARAAARNGVPSYVLVSSAGASPDSRLFYSRMKGELDRDIQKLSFQKISILRPGLLTGQREETRLGEKIGAAVLNLLHRIPGLHRLKPIKGAIVAKAMIQAFFHQKDPICTYTLDEVFRRAE